MALISGGLPHAPASSGPAVCFVALVFVGTIAPFWLFAYGQARVSGRAAGGFVNLEPLVGAAVGWVAFADPLGPWQVVGALAVISGILISLVPPGFELGSLPALSRGHLPDLDLDWLTESDITRSHEFSPRSARHVPDLPAAHATGHLQPARAALVAACRSRRDAPIR